MFIFNLNVVFTMQILKMALSRVLFCPGFPPEAGFQGRNLLQRASRTPEELLSVVHFPRRLLQRGLQSGEECSGMIPHPQREQFYWEDNCKSLPIRLISHL
jgi:hypothetical protein